MSCAARGGKKEITEEEGEGFEWCVGASRVGERVIPALSSISLPCSFVYVFLFVTL